MHRRAATLASLVAALWATACQSARDPETGGETHFLHCETQSDCEKWSPDYVCRDGLCELPVATVPTFDAGPATDAASTLDAGPAADAGPTLDAGPAADAGPLDAGPMLDASDAASDACAAGVARPDEVAILGDSFFATTHETTSELERLALESGVRPPDEHYRDYSRLVQNALALTSNGIADQYADAVAEGAVSVVIMNGGGADALLGSCETIDGDCPVVAQAASAATELLEQMATDGVVDVVYVFYPDAQNDPPTRQKVDAMRPLIQAACSEASTRCHWLDLRDAFDGRYDEFIRADGLNPTTAGSAATAEEIWALMQRECVAQ